MKTIAQRGNCFLVSEGETKGRVVDVVFSSISKKVSLLSLFARGYWGAITDRNLAERALKIMKRNK